MDKPVDHMAAFEYCHEQADFPDSDTPRANNAARAYLDAIRQRDEGEKRWDALFAKAAKLERQRDLLAGLLERTKPYLQAYGKEWAACTALEKEIYAALAALKEHDNAACKHEWGIDGAHTSPEYCKKCFKTKEPSNAS